MMRVTKEEVRGAYKYYGLFYGKSGKVINDEFILKTDDPEEKVLVYDYDEEQWFELDRETVLNHAGSEEWPGEFAEMSEMDALWFLELHHAFNGEGDDDAVEAFIRMWTEKKEQYREAWENGAYWPAKYVKTTFYLRGKQYSITPDTIGLEQRDSWDEGFLEYMQKDIGEDLKKLGATEIRHVGFLD